MLGRLVGTVPLLKGLLLKGKLHVESRQTRKVFVCLCYDSAWHKAVVRLLE